MSEKKVWNAKEHPIICDANGTYIKPKKSLWVADNTVLEGLVNQGFVVILDERQEELAASPKARTTRSKKITEETPEQEQEVEVQLPEESSGEVIDEVATESILTEDEQ